MTQPIHLYWGCARTCDLSICRNYQSSGRVSTPIFTFVPVLSEPDADWHGRSGFVHEAVLCGLSRPVRFRTLSMAGPPMVKVADARPAWQPACRRRICTSILSDYADDSGANAGAWNPPTRVISRS